VRTATLPGANRGGGADGPARRVAVFREAFLPPSETFVRDHLLHLPSWTPVAVTTRRVPGGLDAPGVPVVDTSRRRLPARLRSRVARTLGADPAELREHALADAIRRQRVAVVHAHFGPDAALVRAPARRLSLPLVVTFHGYDASTYPEALRKTPGGARLVDDWPQLMEAAAAVITVSGFLRQELIARGAAPERLHVIPCGVDTSALPWTPPPPDGGVLFVGRLVEKKGCADLLDAVAAFSGPRPRVRIIGDGPLRPALERRARRLRVDAQFLGTRDRAQVTSAMRDCSAVVMPSRRAADGDSEGLPVVSLEASALGRPVVGYRHSGLVESVVSGRTGLLADEGDVAGLATLLEGLLRDPAELRRLAGDARGHVEEHFELRSCLRRVEEVYELTTDPLRDGVPTPRGRVIAPR
jgi:colanic acid/amylovoran biosynthesis glycosyltransferase